MSSTHYKRILLKISGESLMGDDSYGIDVGTVDRIASEISQACNLGIQLCLVLKEMAYLPWSLVDPK